MKEPIIAIPIEHLIGETAKLKVEGYRFVTMSCTEMDADSVDMLYHFDKNLDMKHLRLSAAKTVPVPSISPVFLAAFLVENEIQDLFGIRFQGLVVDYDRTLYIESEVRQTPFCKYTTVTPATKE